MRAVGIAFEPQLCLPCKKTCAVSLRLVRAQGPIIPTNTTFALANSRNASKKQ
jgi:hypothetical protein